MFPIKIDALKYIQGAVVTPMPRILGIVPPFPFDMLRYDNCWPASQEDALELPVAEKLEPGERPPRIELRQATETKQHNWHPERWRSFGWDLEVLK